MRFLSYFKTISPVLTMAKILIFHSLPLIFLICACYPNKHLLTTEIDPPSSIEELSQLNELELIDRKILALLTYADKSYKWRKNAISTYQRLDAYQQSYQGKILARDLSDMHEMASVYVRRIRQPLIKIMRPQYFHMNLRREIKFLENRETFIEHNVIFYQDSSGIVSRNKNDLPEDEVLQRIMVNIYHINPLDPQGQIFLNDFKISFAASLLLLDNYVVALEPYLSNKVLGRSLLYDIPDLPGKIRSKIKNIWLNYEKYHQSSRLFNAVDIYKKAYLIEKNEALLSAGPYSNELDTLIQNSLAFQELNENPSKENFFRSLVNKFKFIAKRSRNEIYRIRFHTTRLLTVVFGVGVGIVNLRNGKLDNLEQDKINDLASKLRPLDILLEKTPFRLTDKFIPGYYGHVGIWLGTEKELKETGLWDLLPHYYQIAKERYSYDGPPFQDSIRQGKYIVEALRTGVEINSLPHFLNIDDLVVIRANSCKGDTSDLKSCLTLDAKQKYLIEAFKQIGKNFDFSFDINTDDEIVCSEIAYRVFMDIDFNTSKILGKFSINPDQIAQLATQEKDLFRPILLYFKGKKVSGNTEELRKLLRLIVSKEIKTAKDMVDKINTSK